MNSHRFLGNMSIYMAAGFILGMILGDPTGMSATLSMIALGIIMTLSMTEIALETGVSGSGMVRGIGPLLLTFCVNTPVFIAASFFFEGELALGWILAASMPAAVAIIPYAERLKGDTALSLSGEIVIYLASLVLTPVIAITALHAEVDITELLKVILILVLIPLIVSRGIRRANLSERVRGGTINLTFLFFFLIVIGANRSVFLEEQITVIKLAVASFITIFGVGILIDRLLAAKRRDHRIVLTLFSTTKNTGLAIAIALSLARPEMALAPTMLVIFELLWVIFLSSWYYADR